MRRFLFHPNTFFNGLLWLVAVGMEIGGWVNHIIAYVLFGIACVWSICTVIYWIKRRGKENFGEKGKQINSEIGKHLVAILDKLHKRDLKLKDKAVRQYYSLFSSKDFRALLDNLMNSISKSEDKVLIKKVKKDLGRKKLSKKADKKQQQIDGLLDSLKPIWDKEWLLADLVAWSNRLDRLPDIQNDRYEGIGKRRDKDKQWGKLFHKLNGIKIQYANIFADKELGRMVNDYLDYSYGGASICFVTDLFNKYVPVDILPSEYIESGASHPYTKVESLMTRLQEKIVNKINELQSKTK